MLSEGGPIKRAWLEAAAMSLTALHPAMLVEAS
jgi:hypothetical protein